MATPREYLRDYYTKYKDFVTAAQRDHTLHTRSHAYNWDHALMVGQFGPLIAEDLREGELAWIAGIGHNDDHLFPRDSLVYRMRRLESHLKLCHGLTKLERHLIVEAILNHGGRNRQDDNPITIILKDADKLANLGALLVIRSGQAYWNLPAYDIRFIKTQDPDATFKDPRTVYRDIQGGLEWREGWFRLPKAIALAEKHFAILDACLANIAEQLKETGLLNMPPELVLPPKLEKDRQQHV